MRKVLFLVIAILLFSVLLLGTIACGENGGKSVTPTTIIDQSVTIESGYYWYIGLQPGDYDVTLNSDDGITVQWIGGGVDQGYNTNEAVKEYVKRSIPVFDSTTFKLYNPTGIFSNPTALVHLKIVKILPE